MAVPSQSKQRVEPARAGAPFSEAAVWQPFGSGWKPLFGNVRELGFSLEWHEIKASANLDWGASFHPFCLEVCINLEGAALVNNGSQSIELSPRMLAFYYHGQPPLSAVRAAGQSHRFVTFELAPAFLREHFAAHGDSLHPLVRVLVQDCAQASQISGVEPVSASLLQLVDSLRHCPVFKPAQEVWFRCKVLEVAAQLFFRPPDGELFCTRAQRIARERVERAQSILKRKAQEPPTLEELGRELGCSPFYLSRQFSAQTGITIQQFIRQVRLERAAELLRTGQCNVTEAAFEVGYSSLSHFTAAFREVFGCCPGLYPLRTRSQEPRSETR